MSRALARPARLPEDGGAGQRGVAVEPFAEHEQQLQEDRRVRKAGEALARGPLQPVRELEIHHEPRGRELYAHVLRPAPGEASSA